MLLYKKDANEDMESVLVTTPRFSQSCPSLVIKTREICLERAKFRMDVRVAKTWIPGCLKFNEAARTRRAGHTTANRAMVKASSNDKLVGYSPVLPSNFDLLMDFQMFDIPTSFFQSRASYFYPPMIARWKSAYRSKTAQQLSLELESTHMRVIISTVLT